MKIFVLILLLSILASCSSGTKIRATDKDKPGSTKYDESFDPNTLNDDDIVIVKQEDHRSEKQNVPIAAITQTTAEFREAKGFRVQILATKSIENATLVEQEAKDLFKNMNHNIYLIFDAPLYKIRVGDVVNRDNAEEIRDVAKDYGYREAFIVPSKVNVSVEDTIN